MRWRQVPRAVQKHHALAGRAAHNIAQHITQLAAARTADSDHRRIAFQMQRTAIKEPDLRSFWVEQTCRA